MLIKALAKGRAPRSERRESEAPGMNDPTMTLADRLLPFTEDMEQKQGFDKMPVIRHVKGQDTQLVASSSGAQSSVSAGRHQTASAQGAEAEKKKAKRERQAADKEHRTGVSKGEAKEEQYRTTCTKRYN